MSSNTLSDFNRLPISFKKSLVKEVLPESFSQEYPSFISFLETYYEFLDGEENFGDLIDDLYVLRDIERTSLQTLDNLFYEVGMGVSHELFANPREVIRNFARFFRVKGTLYSAEGFFRAFFGVDVEIEYPKKDLFVLNQSELGIESLKVLQDGRLYQVLSHLIKAPISMGSWANLYKKFVHPAGFYLGSELQIATIGSLSITGVPVTFDEEENVTKLEVAVSLHPATVQTPTNVTLLDKMGAADYIEDPNTGEVVTLNQRLGLLENVGSYTLPEANDSDQPVLFTRLSSAETVRKYQNSTVQDLILEYRSVEEWAATSSPTVDQSISNNFGINASNEYETVDQEEFDRYDSDH